MHGWLLTGAFLQRAQSYTLRYACPAEFIQRNILLYTLSR